MVGGALLGVVAGALGTAVHLNLAPLPGGWTLPWGAVLALVLMGSTQRWWMVRRAGRGGRALPAGAAVVAGAFTAVLALQRLPVDDALGVSWTAGLWAAAPGYCDRPRNASGGASTLDRSPATPCPERGGRSAMTYVIALPCVDVKDKACIDECPVDCIYEGERMLYIHPDECVDCGACEPVCPVEAIYYEDDTPDEWAEYYKANVEFFDDLGSPGGAAKLGKIAKDHPIISALPLQNADA